MAKQNKRPIKAMFPLNQELSAKDIASSAILKDLLKTTLPQAITSALKERKLYACVFEINNTNHFVELHKKDWVNALESCVVLYAEKEEYEKCSEVTSLIKEIKEKERSPKIKIK